MGDLVWRAEAWQEDSSPGARSAARRTVDIIREKASSITKGVKFTSDLPEDHTNGMVPMLDTQVRVQKGREVDGKWVGDMVRYSYYEKPTTNPKVFAQKGAHSWRNKISPLAPC